MKATTGLLYGGSLVLLLLLVVACGNSSNAGVVAPGGAHSETTLSPIAEGDPSVGQAIFSGEKKIEGVIPCGVCHYVQEQQGVLVGPNMAGLSERAGARVPDMSARQYIIESIREPDAYVVDGFPPGTMNQQYGERLSDQNVEHLIAYLMTL